jgi:hypothetical protein
MPAPQYGCDAKRLTMRLSKEDVEALKTLKAALRTTMTLTPRTDVDLFRIAIREHAKTVTANAVAAQ